MPFKIVRNDITKMNTEAIVNTANPKVAVGNGCDTAVYMSAGKDELLAYRRKYIGDVSEGKAFITPGFKLPAQYIIHAVSPMYHGGGMNEERKLRSCYRNSLNLAKEHHIRSIAFPLISAGAYGYPREEAMRIAVDEIHAFLLKNEMMVYLVVFDTQSTLLGEKIYPDLEAYIDHNYVLKQRQEEYGDPYFRSARPKFMSEVLLGRSGSREDSVKQKSGRTGRMEEPIDRMENSIDRMEKPIDLMEMPDEESELLFEAPRRSEIPEKPITQKAPMVQKVPATPKAPMAQKAPATPKAPMAQKAPVTPKGSMAPKAPDMPCYSWTAKPTLDSDSYDDFFERYKSSLDARMAHQADSFSKYLFYLIREKGMENADVWRRAIIDKKVFSKIKNNPHYHPTKRTALCLCVGAQLNMDETIDLLARAGYALSPCDKTDIIFKYFIEHEIYDMIELDIQLEEYGEPCIIA